MIKPLLTFFIVLVHGARQLNQLAALEEQIVNRISNDSTKSNYLIQKKSLKKVGLMDDCSFVSFWCLYQNQKPVSTIEFIKEISKQEGERRIFYIMKSGFEKYMREKLLNEFLGPLPSEYKEELLFQAYSLYRGRIRSIWARIGEPGTKKFNNWPHIFPFFQKTIHLGIYGTLEAVFNEIMHNLDGSQNIKIFFRLKRQFCMLAMFLLNCENEKYGLSWIADHPDPRLILSFFLYQDYPPSKEFLFFRRIKDKDDDRSGLFEIALDYLKQKTNFKFNRLREKNATFGSEFKNPYSSQIIDKDLKLIISVIISRLLKFCPFTEV
jgi:hypothetical protein